MSKKPGAAKIKWGPKDCSIRLLYKMTSQKLISFVFAAGALLVLIVLARAAKALTAEVVIAAIKAIRDIAIALLAVRGVQGITGIFANKKNGQENSNGDQPKVDPTLG